MIKGLTLQEALQELKVTEKVAKKTLEEDLNIAETNNMEETVTELLLDNGERISVNPCALFANMVVNNSEHMDVDANELEAVVNKYLADEGADLRVVFMPASEYED